MRKRDDDYIEFVMKKIDMLKAAQDTTQTSYCGERTNDYDYKTTELFLPFYLLDCLSNILFAV